MSIAIRKATIDEILQVQDSIEEFTDNPYTEQDILARLEGRKYLRLVATDNENLLGFKLGYAKSKTQLYSWLGGVCPLARRRGVAQMLLNYQENWARTEGFETIQVKSTNQFRGMLLLLLRNQYDVTEVETRQDPADSRIYFLKALT